jgi:hypothetical protein
MGSFADSVFAPLDRDHVMDRVAGGNETEVFLSDDRRFAVKLKTDLGGELGEALTGARAAQQAAMAFARCLGTEHTIASHYVVSRDSAGKAQVLIVQPFVSRARPLAAVDYTTLSPAQRAAIGAQLLVIIRRSLLFYARTGSMPDLYGRSNASRQERERSRSLLNLPRRLWSFLVERTLLHSHNLLLTDDPQPRVVLVDYDTVRRSWLYRLIYFTTRVLLFARDYLAILWMIRATR